MPNRVHTKDAKLALRDILRERAEAGAGGNTLVSRVEAKKLDPVLQRADQEIRRDGGKGTRVHVDALVERATSDSERTWGAFNANNEGRDGVWLSNAEVAAIKQADPALGALTELAMLRVRGRGTPVDPVAAVKAGVATFDFRAGGFHNAGIPGGTVLDVRPGHADRSRVPAAVVAAWDSFARGASAGCTTSLHQGKVGGVDAFVLYTTTDGHDEHLEVFDASGNGLASARLWDGADLRFDPFFGRDRLHARFFALDAPTVEDGMSEAVERAAAGQPPQGWPGDVVINQGEMRSSGGDLREIDFGSTALTPAQREVATAALEVLWPTGFQFQADARGAVGIGPRAQGTLAVGNFTRSTDGKSYEVAAWRDVDDNSHVLYFDRTASGALKLATDQVDG